MKEALSCPSPRINSLFIKSIVKFVNTLVSGNVSSIVVPYLCGASLTALKKKSGSLRPIAVGKVFQRLTSKCISLSVSSEAVRVLSPLQVGVGIPVGCEAIVHSVNSILGDTSIQSECKGTLQIDFSNAFNCVIGVPCLRKSVIEFPPWLHGWSVVTVLNPFSISASTPS